MTRTGISTPTSSSSWEAKLQRRHEFCERFVRKHHPGMADENSLKPLDGPAYCRTGNGHMAFDWWLQTNDSICALGFVWLAHLFERHDLYDHAWMIGRSDQEPWALVSEPYSHVTTAAITELRHELERIGVELLEYPSAQSTHSPGSGILVLVANVLDIHSLARAVAKVIVASGELKP